MTIPLDKPGITKRQEFNGSLIYTLPRFIEGFPPGEIKWGVGGMPEKFEKFPNQPVGEREALSRSFSTVPMGDNRSTMVVITYTTADVRHGGTPPPEPAPLTQHALLWQVSFREVTVEIPKVFIDFNMQRASWDPTGPPSFLVSKRWIWEPKQVIENRTVLRVRWRLTNPGMSEARDFANQQNRIHKLPDGFLWRFMASEMVPVSQTEYEVSVRWEYDAGTPLMSANPQTAWFDPLLPGDMAYIAGHEPGLGLSRDPYHELTIQQDDQTGAPPLQPNQPLIGQSVLYVTGDTASQESWKGLPQFPGF